MPKRLVIIPVFNEEQHIAEVLDELRIWYCCDLLVVNDGSTDASGEILADEEARNGLRLISHSRNLGYGASLIDGFNYAVEHDYDALLCMDSDWQHEPHFVPAFFFALERGVDIVSGSRYLKNFPNDVDAPEQRKRINRIMTSRINEITGFGLTDAFSGFRAMRVAALRDMDLTEKGYAFPLQFWIQAEKLNLSVRELPIPRIYLHTERSFGGELDDTDFRLAYYNETIDRELQRWAGQ